MPSIPLNRDQLIEQNPTLVGRFRRLVTFPENYRQNPCWPWRGFRYRGRYARIAARLNGRSYRLLSHRVAFALQYGHIPGDIEAAHQCPNAWCVNPSHLFPMRTGDHRAADGRRRAWFPGREYVPDLITPLPLFWEGFGLPEAEAEYRRIQAEIQMEYNIQQWKNCHIAILS